jgi:hypothetical protein
MVDLEALPAAPFVYSLDTIAMHEIPKVLSVTSPNATKII